MKMRRSSLYGALFACMLAAAGCSAFAGAEPSRGARGAAWRLHADARPVLGRAGLRAGSAAASGTGVRSAAKAEAPFIAPAEPQDTIVLAPGALLDVWLNDGKTDLRAATSERSLGSAVVRGDFFRYNAVNFDPDLRGFWGQPLLLKWSAFLEITERGPYVFESELSKERGWGAMEVRTLVRVDDQTVFEEEVKVFGSNRIFKTGSRSLTLAPGSHRLEVWLAAENRMALPPATQLGTFLKIRAPGVMTAEPLQPSQVWHRVR